MLQKGFAEIDEVVAYSQQAAEVIDAPGAPPFHPGAGAIAFDNVSFRYAGQATPLYRDFSLRIQPVIMEQTDE